MLAKLVGLHGGCILTQDLPCWLLWMQKAEHDGDVVLKVGHRKENLKDRFGALKKSLQLILHLITAF